MRHLAGMENIDANVTSDNDWKEIMNGGFRKTVHQMGVAQIKNLEKDFHKEDDELTALMLSCKNGHANCIGSLLKIVDIDINAASKIGLTALMFACQNGHVECVKHLVKVKSLNINAMTKDGMTALMYTCQNRHVECLHCLVQAENINLNSTSADGTTVLMLACKYRHTECVLLSLQRQPTVAYRQKCHIQVQQPTPKLYTTYMWIKALT